MMRWRARTGIAVAAFLAFLVLATLAPRPLMPAARSGEPASRRIVVLSNAIHTDIALPIDDDLLARFIFLRQAGIPTDYPGAQYLVFGWGSRAFYLATPTWSDLRPGPALKALTLDASVMHVDIAGALDLTQAGVRSFQIDEADMRRLQDFIAASFTVGPDGPIRIAGAGYGPFDGFFEANGRFTAAAGCNTWTAAALREAGLRTGWWNPLPQSLAISLDLYNRSVTP